MLRVVLKKLVNGVLMKDELRAGLGERLSLIASLFHHV